MPSRTFHSDPMGDVWYDSAGAGGVASYGVRQRIGMMMLGLLDRMEVLHITMIHIVVYMIPTVIKTRE